MRLRLDFIVDFDFVHIYLIKEDKKNLEYNRVFSFALDEEVNLDEIIKTLYSKDKKVDSSVNLYILDDNQFNQKIVLPKTSVFKLDNQINKEIRAKFEKDDYLYSSRVFDYKKKGIFVFNTILLKDKIDKIESLLKKSNLKIKYIYSIREIIEIKSIQNNFKDGLIVMDLFDKRIIGIVKDNKTLLFSSNAILQNFEVDLLRILSEHQFTIFKESIHSILSDNKIESKITSELDFINSNDQCIFNVPKEMLKRLYKRGK